MSMALLARKGVLPYLIAGVVLGGSLGLSLSGWAQDQRVTAAEVAVEQALPAGATIIGSEALDVDTAEVLVDYQGQRIQVRMQRDQAGDWQQDINATLIRGAQELQLLLAQDGSVPAIGQAPDSESLLETTTSSTTLISPTDIDEATRNALNRAGRRNPFEPLDEIVISPTEAEIPDITLPPIDQPPPPVALPPLPTPGEDPAPIPVATPTPDPAAFARMVDVTGIIQIDGESFAFLNASGQEPAVVRSGDNYQSAQVTQISPRTREVVLTEGGQFVSKPISASVLTEAP